MKDLGSSSILLNILSNCDFWQAVRNEVKGFSLQVKKNSTQLVVLLNKLQRGILGGVEEEWQKGVQLIIFSYILGHASHLVGDSSQRERKKIRA